MKGEFVAYRPRKLQFPLGGLHRGGGYQSQPPYTTPDALNMRPIETIEGRARGGVRPGLMKPHRGHASATAMRLMAEVNYLRDDDFDLYEDDFAGRDLSGEWAIPTWMGSFPTLNGDGWARIAYSNGTRLDGCVGPLQNVEVESGRYYVQAFIAPYNGAYRGAKYRLYAGLMNGGYDPTGNPGGGIVAEIEMAADGNINANVKTYDHVGALTKNVDSTDVGQPGELGAISTTYPCAGWMSLYVGYNTANTVLIALHFRGVTLINIVAASPAYTYPETGWQTMGFGAVVVDDEDVALFRQFRQMFYSTETVEKQASIIVCSGDGRLFREKEVGNLSLVASDYTLASDRLMHATQYGQSLYIADCGTPVLRGAGDISQGTGGTLLEADGVDDWNTVGIDQLVDLVAVSKETPSSGALAGTYGIGGVLGTDPRYLRLYPVNSSAGPVTFSIEVGPKVYDPKTDLLMPWYERLNIPMVGNLPVGCNLIATYRARIILAGKHVWYMCRQNNPWDWDIGADVNDAQRAVGGPVADAGLLGKPITAVAPFGDDFVIFGCSDELWILRGDPALGGSLDNFSRDHGIVSMGAWCYGPNNLILFLGQDGLFVVPADGSSPPENLSDRPLPLELKRVDPEQYEVLMSYDSFAEGVHLFLTGGDPRKRRHWWFDWSSRGFWPVSLADDHEPTAIMRHTSQSAFDNGVLLGCRDGYTRMFRDECENDDDTAIDSYVLYGPIALGPDGYGGMLDEIVAALPQGSGAADWEVHVAETAEEAVEAAMNGDTAFASGNVAGSTNWAAGLNNVESIQGFGGAAVIKVSGGATQRWAIEAILAKVTRADVQLID